MGLSARTWIIIIIVIILIIATYVIAKKVKKRLASRKAEKEFEASAISGVIGGTQYSINPASVATEIHDAFYDNDWFGASEDEEKAIIAINNVPKNFVPLVSQAYYSMFKLNLNAEMQKYLDVEYDKVRSQFN